MDDTGNPVDESESIPSLRDTLEAAVAETSAPPASGESAPAPEQQADSRARDEHGRFAQKEDKPADPAEKTVEQQAQTTPQADKPVETQTTQQGPQAPVSWNAPARELFAKADPALREYIAQRDAEQQAGVAKLKQTYEGKAQFAESMWREIAPYQQLIQKEGGTPETAVRQLLETAAIFRTGSPEQKGAALAQIARTYGVDLNQFANAVTNPQPVAQVIRDPRVDQIEQHLRSMQQAAIQQQQQSLISEIEGFKPNAPHFDTVREDMAALLETGRASDLKDAYEKAVWLNPQTRSALQSEQQAKQEAERKAASQQQVARARSAAVSVTGAPGLAGNGNVAAPAPSLRAELEQAFAVNRA